MKALAVLMHKPNGAVIIPYALFGYEDFGQVKRPETALKSFAQGVACAHIAVTLPYKPT